MTVILSQGSIIRKNQEEKLKFENTDVKKTLKTRWKRPEKTKVQKLLLQTMYDSLGNNTQCSRGYFPRNSEGKCCHLGVFPEEFRGGVEGSVCLFALYLFYIYI